MKNLKTNKYLVTLLCLLLISACQNKKQQNTQEKGKKQDYTYKAQQGRLLIKSKTVNSELKSVALYADNEEDSITSAKPDQGKFTLDVNDIALHEVYFLKLRGVSTKRGTSGLKWEEWVPVFASSADELTLVQQAFQDVGSISKVKFSIQGGGDEQALLNDWHEALVELQAEKEGQMEHYTIGGSGATKVAGRKGSVKTEASITTDFIAQQKALTSSLYLISRVGKHRQHAKDYQALLDKVTEPAKNSKYGLALAKQLDLFNNKITRLDLEKQVVATDTRLSAVPWDSFKDRQYLVLSFWNSLDPASSEVVKKLKGTAPALAKKGIDVLLISMENQFTIWQKAAKQLDFEHNYKMRNEARQALIDTLYLSELPRLLLVKPNGEIINDDLSLEQVQELE